MPLPPPAMPAPPASGWLRLGVFAGWLLFMLMVIAITWAGSLIRGRPFDVAATLVWNAGWLFWAAATFGVARLARAVPIERGRLAASLAAHAGFGVVIGVAILLLEFFFGQAVAALWAGAPRANAFLGFIVYKFHVYFLIYWMIVGSTRAFDYYAKYRASTLHASQLEARLAQAQLLTLKSQLQPHFLFNTHHAIISLMLKPDSAAAIKMLTRLSDLLRMTLRKTDQQFSSLREEFEALDLYLGIQAERFRERLRVERDIEPAALSAEVPWLLLQPLVENALRHGIEPLPAGGELRLSARVEADRLILTVADNGPGFPASRVNGRAEGIGLSNTAARLDRLYGPAHAFSATNLPAASGACVHISLPFRLHAEPPPPASPALAHHG